jgi:hypothetical protein
MLHVHLDIVTVADQFPVFELVTVGSPGERGNKERQKENNESVHRKRGVLACLLLE